MKIITYLRDIIEVLVGEYRISRVNECSIVTSLRYAVWAFDEVFVARSHQRPSQTWADIDAWAARHQADDDSCGYDPANDLLPSPAMTYEAETSWWLDPNAELLRESYAQQRLDGLSGLMRTVAATNTAMPINDDEEEILRDFGY